MAASAGAATRREALRQGPPAPVRASAIGRLRLRPVAARAGAATRLEPSATDLAHLAGAWAPAFAGTVWAGTLAVVLSPPPARVSLGLDDSCRLALLGLATFAFLSLSSFLDSLHRLLLPTLPDFMQHLTDGWTASLIQAVLVLSLLIFPLFPVSHAWLQVQ